jgi:transposase
MEMTIQEAAKHFKVSEQTIRRRLAEGIITGTKEHHRWTITIEDKSPAEARAENASQSEILWLREQLETRNREVAELHQLLAAHSLNPGPPAPEPELPPYPAHSTPWWAFWR